MSANGHEAASDAEEVKPSSPTDVDVPVLDTLTIKDDPSNASTASNGIPHESDEAGLDTEVDKQQLLEELDQIKGEKEQLESQYRALLGKLTTMRNTLGDKLRQDAVSLLSLLVSHFY